MPPPTVSREVEDAWLWGWDSTPGIVSVSAEPEGRVTLWRRAAKGGALSRGEVRFRPWLLLSSLVDLRHLGARLRPEGAGDAAPDEVTFRELQGPGALRFQVFATDGRKLTRETLGFMCRELAARGVTLLEADMDGVYFAVPEGCREEDVRRIVAEVAALPPTKVHLEFEGRYAAVLSHQANNYALAPYSGPLVLRGVAFRSRRAEAYGVTFLRRAIELLLAGDIRGVRLTFVETVLRLRQRGLPTREVSTQVRLTKTSEQYAEVRGQRKELPYEAMISNGRPRWSPGERVLVYRTGKGAGLWMEEEGLEAPDRRDYDVEYYVRLLRETFSARLARALRSEDFAAVFADPEQPSLFPYALEGARPILSVQSAPG